MDPGQEEETENQLGSDGAGGPAASRQKPWVGKSREAGTHRPRQGRPRQWGCRAYGAQGGPCLALKESVCLWNVCVLGQKCKLATGLPLLPSANDKEPRSQNPVSLTPLPGSGDSTLGYQSPGVPRLPGQDHRAAGVVRWTAPGPRATSSAPPPPEEEHSSLRDRYPTRNGPTREPRR